MKKTTKAALGIGGAALAIGLAAQAKAGKTNGQPLQIPFSAIDFKALLGSMKPTSDMFVRHEACVSYDGHSIPLLIISPKDPQPGAPGVLWIHGGGYITGMKEMVYASRAVDLVQQFGCTVVSPGYRLAPQHRFPAAAEDCYAALLWLADNAVSLDVAPDCLMVGSESAGGGLTAAVCMMARDRAQVTVSFQMPLYPMLSNLDTASSADNHGQVWNTRLNHLGWRAYLGKDARSETLSPYASPAHQSNYENLPPAYTFVGEGEPFRDETIAYVEALRKAGVEAECDVYPTDVHAFDMVRPRDELSKQAAQRFCAPIYHAWIAKNGCNCL